MADFGKTFSLYRKKNGFWELRTNKNGRRISQKSLKTKKKSEASAALALANASRFAPGLMGPEEYIPFSQALEDFRRQEVALAGKTSNLSAIAYNNRLQACKSMLPENKNIFQVVPRDLQAWYLALINQYAPKTTREILRLVRKLFDHYEIHPNPAARLKAPKKDATERPFWTMDEIRAILDRAPSPGDKMYWSIMAYQGLRSAEASALKWSEVDLKRREITILTGKGKISRVLPIHPEILAMLQEEVSRAPTGLVVQGVNRHSYSRLRVLKIATADLSFQRSGPVTLHRFRHSFASNLLRAGCNIKAVQLLMGHSSIKTTLDTYGHLLPEDLDKTIGMLT